MTPLTTASQHSNGSAVTARRDAPATVGGLLLETTARHSGVALQFWRDGAPAYISYPELGDDRQRDRARADQPRDRTGRPRRDPRADVGRVDARRLRRAVRRRGGRADLPHQLPGRSAHTCSQHSGARVVFCENAAQAAKVEQVRDRCPALEQIVLFEDADDELADAGRAAADGLRGAAGRGRQAARRLGGR